MTDDLTLAQQKISYLERRISELEQRLQRDEATHGTPPQNPSEKTTPAA